MSAELEALVQEAIAVRERAYAPYSGYKGAAALRADDGRIFTGVNVESAAYPTCVCAEVNALTTAIAAGARRFEAIAVVTVAGPDGRAGSPCGNCRQALMEHAPKLQVVLSTPEGVAETTSLAELLPKAFTPERL